MAETYDKLLESDSPPAESQASGDDILNVSWSGEGLPPNVYSVATCSLIRDMYVLVQGLGPGAHRYGRMGTSMLVMMLCIALQLILLAQVKRFVCARNVHDMRIAYDRYERHMYGGHVDMLPNLPEARGRGGMAGPYFNANFFRELSYEAQEKICSFPLSQPQFLALVLIVWTYTCVVDIRCCWRLFQHLVLTMPTCDHFGDCFEGDEGVRGEKAHCEVTVVGLPWTAKAVVTFMVLLPQFTMTVFLMWVGCRWLLATANFSDLVLNSVALEFLLNLKETLYFALAPRRSMLDVDTLRIGMPHRKEAENMLMLLGGTMWGLLSILWVALYIGTPVTPGLQGVLRGYQWDVRAVCVDWLRENFSV